MTASSIGRQLFSAASRTPPAILKKLHDAGKDSQADRQAPVAGRAQSNEPWVKSTPEDLKRRLADDTRNWARVYAQVGPLQ